MLLDDLRQLARELEDLQKIKEKGFTSLLTVKMNQFAYKFLDDAIKIISDAEERIAALEARP